MKEKPPTLFGGFSYLELKRNQLQFLPQTEAASLTQALSKLTLKRGLIMR